MIYTVLLLWIWGVANVYAWVDHFVLELPTLAARLSNKLQDYCVESSWDTSIGPDNNQEVFRGTN